jgi:type II secretory pathway predicted ATPase ExeA
MALPFKFSADAPINSSTSDLLGRTGFAASCAEAIANWQDDASLVIAIWGDWGAGKSSLKNLIIENLVGLDEDRRPAIVEFNPWQVIDSDQLLSAFFAEIGKVLERPIGKEEKKAAEVRGARWKAYSTVLSLGGSIAKSGAVLASLLASPIAGLPLVTAGEMLERAAKLTKEGAEGLEAEAKTIREKTTSELKSEVAEALKPLQRSVLIVLDDLDRLTSSEIRHVIQLVKATADFPHLVYLILARRESVVEALKDIAPGSAEEFLEKIVQVPLHMPRIKRSQIGRLLTAGLDRLLADPNFAKHFDNERWVTLYRDGMENFFETPRDVNRYLSSLAFHVGVFRSGLGNYEVNAVDLFGIETLRVFTPALYERLPELRGIVTDQFSWRREKSKAEDHARLKALLNSADEAQRPAAQHILEVLFPPAHSLFRGSHFSDTSQETAWVIGLRIASEKQFDRYFGLSVPSDEVSEDELQDLLGKMPNRTALEDKFADFASRGLLEQALDSLDYHRYGLDRTDPMGVLTALLSLDVHGRNGFFLVPFSPQMHIWRITYAYLREEPSLPQRAKLLGDALNAASNLRTCVAIAQHAVSHSETNTSGPDMLLETGPDLDAIKVVVVSKIKNASSTGTFADDADLILWLQTWKSWGGTNEPGQWATALCASSFGLLQFLRAFRAVARSQGSSPLIKEHEFFVLGTLEEFVDLSFLRAEVSKLAMISLTEEEQRIVALFQKAAARRDAGEPDYTAVSWAWENHN